MCDLPPDAASRGNVSLMFEKKKKQACLATTAAAEAAAQQSEATVKTKVAATATT